MSKNSQRSDAPAERPSTLNAHLADPSLIVVDGKFYLYPTTDGYPEWGADAFQMFSSENLVDWRAEGEVLRLGRDVTWAEKYAWAPAAHHRDGRFYLYFSAAENIGVAVADHPAGPFVDIGQPLVRAEEYDGSAIDPSIFEDSDGTTWLLWGNTVAHAVRLNDDLVSFDPSEVVSWVPTAFREAIAVHQRGDIYYATWSENDTRDPEYRVRWASGPSPVGPWTDGGVLLEQIPSRGILATGHHDILRLPDSDDWVIAYHRFSVPYGNGFTREIVFDWLLHGESGELMPVVPATEPIRASLRDTSSIPAQPV